MRKEVKTTHISCDLCGQQDIEPVSSTSEIRETCAILIRYEVWYGGHYEMKDFCGQCQGKIAAFLGANMAVGRGQKV